MAIGKLIEFTISDDLFEFNVMPFRLCNTPATFQQLMDLVLAGKWFSIYNDIIIIGKDFQSHLNKPQLVLPNTRDSSLKLKPHNWSL